ncbi:quinol:cytochrome c oxidoreductase monoheme cytochrome subunit [Hyunsoonleella jejuensis]|uniref:Quinol:cytochrome c oxidoreductase monoheme cytochrome subunit n=1 Tax=Hyunsoonleella jejuensis TaxID=419940 RepID=A0A1H9AGJ8_9FLAO|nr:cytochrome c [Hyunsoonleella jejuensis]SEP75078.1 quinol:cytochrome c oxidoreductase monoheme cytochrome subunit [Hyunsoonleella jejuensis]
MKSLIKILVAAVVFVAVSCKKDTAPNYQYMPNMYESVGYETYGENELYENGMAARTPAEGSIPRGFVPFDIENSTEGYEFAKATVRTPLDSTQIDLERGKELYDIYCGICHGNKGDGQGKLVKREKILGIPSYDDAGRAINEGSIYHTIYYGKNAMGSYANQLNEEERWQVVSYVLKLKADLEK